MSETKTKKTDDVAFVGSVLVGLALLGFGVHQYHKLAVENAKLETQVYYLESKLVLCKLVDGKLQAVTPKTTDRLPQGEDAKGKGKK